MHIFIYAYIMYIYIMLPFQITKTILKKEYNISTKCENQNDCKNHNDYENSSDNIFNVNSSKKFKIFINKNGNEDKIKIKINYGAKSNVNENNNINVINNQEKYNDNYWINKYKPYCLNDIIGNDENKDKLVKWFNNYINGLHDKNILLFIGESRT